jgi:hypothetical protein
MKRIIAVFPDYSIFVYHHNELCLAICKDRQENGEIVAYHPVEITPVENISEALTGEQERWISVEERLPENGVAVSGYNKKWIDEDYNPLGIRESVCYGQPSLPVWQSAKWCGLHDEWHNDTETIPTHWQPLPTPPLSNPVEPKQEKES